jgi:hypothetical protein
MTLRRRRPTDEVIVETTPECPGCPHPATIHNQFGCCFNEEVCPCLKTRAEIEAKEDTNEEDG